MRFNAQIILKSGEVFNGKAPISQEKFAFGEVVFNTGMVGYVEALTDPSYSGQILVFTYPALLRSIAKALWDLSQPQHCDLICGVPYTALPIATCISLDHDLPMVMRRKEKKDYGTKQSIEGQFSKGQTCLLIEDIITSGSSLLETAKDLEAAGLIVPSMCALIDRQQGGKQHLEKKYHIHTLLTLPDILNHLLHAKVVSTNERHLIEQFLMEKTAK